MILAQLRGVEFEEDSGAPGWALTRDELRILEVDLESMDDMIGVHPTGGDDRRAAAAFAALIVASGSEDSADYLRHLYLHGRDVLLEIRDRILREANG
jgi:hypothetical protein